MPQQFSILSEAQKAKPTPSEPTSKECSKSIHISVYKPNPFRCLLHIKVFQQVKGSAQMIYLIFPLTSWVPWDHILDPLQHNTVVCHQHGPQQLETQACQGKCYEKQKHLIGTEIINSCAGTHFTDHLLFRAKTRLSFKAYKRQKGELRIQLLPQCEKNFEHITPVLGWWGKPAKIIFYLHIKRQKSAF